MFQLADELASDFVNSRSHKPRHEVNLQQSSLYNGLNTRVKKRTIIKTEVQIFAI